MTAETSPTRPHASPGLVPGLRGVPPPFGIWRLQGSWQEGESPAARLSRRVCDAERPTAMRGVQRQGTAPALCFDSSRVGDSEVVLCRRQSTTVVGILRRLAWDSSRQPRYLSRREYGADKQEKIGRYELAAISCRVSRAKSQTVRQQEKNFEFVHISISFRVEDARSDWPPSVKKTAKSWTCTSIHSHSSASYGILSADRSMPNVFDAFFPLPSLRPCALKRQNAP